MEDKQPEEKTNTDCLVNDQENVHLGIKVGENITVTGVPGQEGVEGNVAEKKKVKESMKANLGKLLKYNAWSTSFQGNCVYSLDGWAESGEASVAIQEKKRKVLRRYSLVKQACMNLKKEVLGNNGLGKLEFCENCVLRKSTRVSFGRGQHTTDRVIDYVHADLWGPSRVESMSGCRYFLSIVDDYSRRVWVHFLRHKNEAFSKFKEWKQLVENQTGRKLKKLRTDNGLEFCNQEFNNLCKESGIARHLTVAGTPQQNGLAERMNMTLLNKVRCLLIQSGLPDSFWAEATVTAAYLINRSPSTALEKMTPMDLWSGHPANYEMLRIFGCVAYSHVNQGKLKPRAIKCIFLGYPDGVKGYRLWRLDDVKPKIIISRDVVFNESLMYKDTLKGAGAADSGKEVEFEVELQGSRVEPTVDPHTGENPGNEDEEQDEGPQQQNLDNYVLVDDMAAYAFAIAEEEDTHEPITFQEAINSSEKDEWVRAMKEEMSSLKKNHTWELVDQPPGQKLVSCKWLYKIKEGIEGVQKPRYKARLVARGFTQRAGIDYNEVFSPVVRHTSIRVILSLTACEDYELEQLDVKTAFLHGNLEETIYMRQPPGFEEGTGNKVCLLKKSLYGLKQSPRQWYKRFDVYMISNGFSRSNYDSCVYFKEFAPGMYIYLLLYVDDMLIACKSKYGIENTKGLLQKEFDMKELVQLGRYFVWRSSGIGSVSVPLGAHFNVSLKDYPPDIVYAFSIVSTYLANPGLVYGRDQGKHVDVDGFVDADYAKDPDKGMSIMRYVFMVHGCVVSWKATLQHVVALSTEAKYMTLTEAVKESIWLKGLLIELGVNLREIVESKKIAVAKVGTKDNAADAFTKVVPGPKFKYCMEILGIGAN
ncbi:retrotransposon protein, putative, ty1-copia subclass [Tanacetum coccineum]